MPPAKAINPIGIPRQKSNPKPDPNNSPSLRRDPTLPDNGLSGRQGLSSKVGTPLGSGHGGSVHGPGSVHGGPGSVHGGPGSVHGGPGSVHGGPGSVHGAPGSVHGGPGSVHGGSVHGSGLCSECQYECLLTADCSQARPGLTTAPTTRASPPSRPRTGRAGATTGPGPATTTTRTGGQYSSQFSALHSTFPFTGLL